MTSSPGPDGGLEQLLRHPDRAGAGGEVRDGHAEAVRQLVIRPVQAMSG